MAGKKDKKRKKDKLNRTWPNIGAALFPRPMVAVVPKSQTVVPESPKVLKKTRSPFVTGILTASLGGRVIASPHNSGDFGTMTGSLDGTGTQKMARVSSSPGSLAGSSMYNYDDMPETPGYSTIDTLRHDMAQDEIDNRPKAQTPPESETESELEDDEEEESPRSPHPQYNVIDREAEYRQERVQEIIYSQPNKLRKQGKERPSSVTSDLTVVSSPLDDFSDLGAPPPPWERKRSNNGFDDSGSPRRSKSTSHPIIEEPIVKVDVSKSEGGRMNGYGGSHISSQEPDDDLYNVSVVDSQYIMVPMYAAPKSVSDPGPSIHRTIAHNNDRYDHLQRKTATLNKKYQIVKDENRHLKDELDLLQAQKDKMHQRLEDHQETFQTFLSSQEEAMKSKMLMIEKRCNDLEVQKHAVMEVNNQLHAENESLKKLAASLKENGAGASSLAFRQQTQDMSEEIEVLRSTVHRLNVELSRYQAKYRPPEKGDPPGMPSVGPVPHWLTNTKYLAPLLLSYDDRLKEKDSTIEAYEHELNQFKSRVEEVIEENQRLHSKSEQYERTGKSFISPSEWHQLQEQAKLVLEENQLLMEQLDIQQNKQKEVHKQHLQEVSRISKKLILSESEKSSLETDLMEVRHKYSSLKNKHEASLVEGDQKMPIQEHYSTVADFKRSLSDLNEKHAEELENILLKLQATEKEKKTLALNLTDAKAENKQLEGEIRALQRALKKSQHKIVKMQKELEYLENKGAVASHHLDSVLKVAEQTVQERDHYYQAAQKEAQEKEKVVNKMMEGNITIGKMQEKLKLYKMKAEEKYGNFALKLQEKSEDFNHKTQEYEREMRHLQLLLKDKQESLDNMSDEKRRVENELETIWQSATADNRRMKAALSKSLRKSINVYQDGAMYRTDSDEKVHMSSESDN